MSRGISRALLLPLLELVPVQPQRLQPDVAHGAFADAVLPGQNNIRGYLAASQCGLDDGSIDRLDSPRRLLRGLPRPTTERRNIDTSAGLTYTGHWTLWPSLGYECLLAQAVYPK
jgi:hypothetical protein